jgi:hypothetical protein
MLCARRAQPPFHPFCIAFVWLSRRDLLQVPLLPCLLQAWPLAGHAAAVPCTRAYSHAADQTVPRPRACHCKPRLCLQPCRGPDGPAPAGLPLQAATVLLARRRPSSAASRRQRAAPSRCLCRTSGKNPGWFSGLGSMGLLGQVHRSLLAH